MDLNKKHFAGLDELRGIACIMVLLNHLTFYKDLYGFGDTYTHLLFRNWQASGLILFFVLSGFLISYLLLTEQAEKGKISAGKFYMRRILRIWPLYFVIILLGHVAGVWATDFFDPKNTNEAIKQQYWVRTALYVLILPNIVYLKFSPSSVLTSHTWSIGVEEQFYWVWPWLIVLIRKRLAFVMIGLVALMFISEALYAYLDHHREMMVMDKRINILSKLNAFFYWSKAGYFAAGALLAYWFLNAGNIKKYICHPVSIIGACLGVIIFTYWFHCLAISGMLLACSFTFLIGNIIWRGSPFGKLAVQALGFAGKVSYGVYMYHPLVLIAILSAIQYREISISGFFSNLSLFIVSISAVLLIASASYYWLELPFLRFRSRFK